MMKQMLISFDEWVERFKPVKNAIKPTEVYDGFMFETYGAEHDVVAKAEQNNIWTLLDSDDGQQIDSGYARVNRMGYFITEVPAPPGVFMSVIDDPQDYLKMLKKQGYFRIDPSTTYDLSPAMAQAWLDIKTRAKTKPNPKASI